MSPLHSQPTSKAQRLRATASALGSVRAEGLEPSRATLKRLEQYANGVITAQELTEQTFAEVQSSAARTTKV